MLLVENKTKYQLRLQFAFALAASRLPWNIWVRKCNRQKSVEQVPMQMHLSLCNKSISAAGDLCTQEKRLNGFSEKAHCIFEAVSPL